MTQIEATQPGTSRLRSRKMLMLVLGLTTVLSGAIGGTVAFVPPAQAVSGSAVVTLGYDNNLSQYSYKCTFAGWARIAAPGRTYHCILEDVYGNVYADREGKFSGTYYQTPLTYFKRTNTTMCVVAKVGSVTDRECN